MSALDLEKSMHPLALALGGCSVQQGHTHMYRRGGEGEESPPPRYISMFTIVPNTKECITYSSNTFEF